MRYGAAAGLTAAALGVTLWARELLGPSTFILFFVSVSVSAWVGGLGPAFLATALAVLSVDYFIITPGGSLLPASATDLVPLTAFCVVSAIISFLSDSARRAERRARAHTAELERNREFLEQAQRSAQLGSWEWDVASNRVAWSAEMFRTYGLEPGGVPLSFDGFIDAVHPDDRDMVRATIEGVFRSHEPFAFDHRVVWPDGTVRWLHGRGGVQMDGAGQVVRMVGSGQDITERRRSAEAQRFLSEASAALGSSTDYNATLSTVADLAVQSLADWCSVAIGDASGAYENIAVAHRDPARVQWAIEYNRLHPPRLDAPTGVPNVLRTGRTEFYPEIAREMLLASGPSEQELRVLEELKMQSAIIVPLIARERTLGAITFVAAESGHRFTPDDVWLAERLASRAAAAIDAARLLQEARAARADAEAANRTKMDFLAAMSHELRTPLNAIAGYSELLEMGIHGSMNDAQRETVVRMRRSQRHLQTLVEDILSFAKIEAGKTEFEMGEVRINDALTRVGELVAAQVEAKNLVYENAGCDPGLAAYADRARVEQIVLNLLSNAIKFTAPGGRIRLAVEPENGTLAISVTDSGVGIQADKAEAIFQPFVQLEQGKEKRATGVGLGLAISRDLARAMGGDVTVRSTVGKGSTFTLRLPRSRADAAVTSAEPLPPELLGKPKELAQPS